MDWINRLQNALNYIEDNMDKDLNTDIISKQANTTAFHFQRMFSIITGIPLAEYIRKRRLTLAAQELIAKNVRIIDVAMKYGYATQASFTRAFSHFHGFSPGMICEPNMKIQSYLPVSFQISIKGDENMEYVIKKTGSIRLVGKAKSFTTKNQSNIKEIPEFWKNFVDIGLEDKLFRFMSRDGITKKAILGVCMDFSENQEEFSYMIAVESGINDFPDEFEEKIIPASTWAIFKSKGPMPESIQNLIKRIYSEWFPSTKYIHAGSPEMELYFKDNEFEVWIPIKEDHGN